MSTSDDIASAVAAAVAFVATQAGGAQRILKQHYPLPGSGMCAGCQVVPTRYPCTAARIAELARQLAAHDNCRGPDSEQPEPALTHRYLSQRTVDQWRQLASEYWGKS